MRKLLVIVVVANALLLSVSQAQDITLKTAPAVVVKTVPESGARNVDPATTELRVTFSKPMQNRSWSWANAGKDTTPETTGEPKYQKDKRTCVLPVKLQPGKTYAYWLNTERFRNFKDANGQPAVPYLLIFKTKGKPSA
jgi:RNA polymerase sigma-70 factor (ECF subfamily)